ncbi:hypothetical protein DPEC_G00090750 [Dallia pectoralis]|uniref:Uncharacterized protein n=1 Tax=Dallia pectoralis TaxID=75939 RepID=A0ACC2H119_DALPE|nr:hypothetical protein DPEC_G00090750 [Dallia pectoralis]
MFCSGLRQPALSSTALSVGCPLQESAHFSLESLFGCLLGCRVLQLLRKKIIEKTTLRCSYQDLVDVCEVWDFAHSC